MRPSFWLAKLEERTKDLPAFLVILLFISLLLRLPSLFEPFWYGDEGIYLTLGQAIRQGQVLYRDIHDNKPPLLYWVAAIAGSVFWFRFILMVWLMGTTVVFFKLAKKFFKEDGLALLLTSVFILLTSLPLFEGTITNAEHFFIGLVILGFYFFIEKRFWRSGLMFGVAFLFKSPPFLDWSSLLIFSFLLAFSKREQFFAEIKNKWPLVVGFVIPVGLTFVLYALEPGALSFYLESAWLQNLPYLFAWMDQEATSLLSKQLFWRGLILLLVLGAIFLKRKLLLKKQLFLLVLLWLILAIFGAFMSSRPYPHYLLQVAAPLVLLIGFLLSFLKNKEKITYFLFGLSPIVLLLAGFFYYQFYTYPVIGYYQNFIEFSLGRRTQADYLNWFDQKTERNYQVASFLNDFLLPRERFFIWGNEPNIYALSRRLPVGRYTVAYHIHDFNRYQEVLSAIKNNPPRIIIYDLDHRYSFADLLAFLFENYYPIKQFGSLQVWSHLSL